MQYCIYLRKSRKDEEAERRGEGETLARHEKALLALAKSQQLSITKIYREIVSGDTIAARPVMQKLLEEVGNGVWDGVLVMEIERLARGNTMDQGLISQAFQFSGTKIITPIKTYDPANEFDEEYFEFGLFMSRREYTAIKRRMQRGRIASFKEGNYIAGNTPYGYDRATVDGHPSLAVNNREAEIVRMIFSLYIHGVPTERGYRVGVGSIAKYLNGLQIPSKRKKGWSAESVRGILTNPVYIGKTRWRWREQEKRLVDGKVLTRRPLSKNPMYVDAKHPHIIDEDTFETVQKMIESRYSWPVNDRYRITNPLAGIARCAKCGRMLLQGKRKDGTPYLYCRNSQCDNVSSNLPLIEDRMLEAISQWLKDYRFQADQTDIRQESPSLLASLSQVDVELQKLDSQQNRLYDLLEQGVYSSEVFVQRSDVLSKKIKAMQAQKKSLEEMLVSQKISAQQEKQMVPKMQTILSTYRELSDPADQNRLLKEVLAYIEYEKNTPHGSGYSNDDFTIKIFPRTF